MLMTWCDVITSCNLATSQPVMLTSPSFLHKVTQRHKVKRSDPVPHGSRRWNPLPLQGCSFDFSLLDANISLICSFADARCEQFRHWWKRKRTLSEESLISTREDLKARFVYPQIWRVSGQEVFVREAFRSGGVRGTHSCDEEGDRRVQYSRGGQLHYWNAPQVGGSPSWW